MPNDTKESVDGRPTVVDDDLIDHSSARLLHDSRGHVPVEKTSTMRPDRVLLKKARRQIEGDDLGQQQSKQHDGRKEEMAARIGDRRLAEGRERVPQHRLAAREPAVDADRLGEGAGRAPAQAARSASTWPTSFSAQHWVPWCRCK